MKIVHTNRWFQVSCRIEQGPTGSSEWYRVIRPDSAVIIAVIGSDIAMIRGTRDTLGPGTFYELPAGGADGSESLEDTAKRELREETGIRPGRITKIAEFLEVPGLSSARTEVFVATDCSLGEQELEESEHWQVELCSPQRLIDLQLAGKIQDGQTLATLWLWDIWKQKNLE